MIFTHLVLLGFFSGAGAAPALPAVLPAPGFTVVDYRQIALTAVTQPSLAVTSPTSRPELAATPSGTPPNLTPTPSRKL